MGFPFSLMLANMNMEHFEEAALRAVENPPRLWKWNVDHVFVIQDTEQKENFLYHINTIDKAIKFTLEDARLDGSMLSLNIILAPEQNRIMSISVNRKPTITCFYYTFPYLVYSMAVLIRYTFIIHYIFVK